jgi:hypothetical protein
MGVTSSLIHTSMAMCYPSVATTIGAQARILNELHRAATKNDDGNA